MSSEKKSTDTYVKFFVSVIGIIVIGATLKELQSIILPFVIAYLLYFAFSPVNTWLSERKIPIGIIIIADLLVMLVAAGVISLFFIEPVTTFQDNFDQYATKLNTIVRTTAQSYGIKDPFFQSFSLQRIIAKLDFKALAGGAVSSMVDIAGTVLLVIFFFAFIVGGHHAIYGAIKRRFSSRGPSTNENESYFPEYANPDAAQRTMYSVRLESTIKEITQQIQKYIITKLFVNLTAGLVTGFVLWLFNIDFYILWGMVVFFFNFIPTIGSAAALVLPSLMALVQTGSIGFMALIAVIIMAIQTAVFNFMEPMLIGKRLDLNPIAILLSVLVWGYVWGIVGMLLAVPLTAIIKIALTNSQNQNVRFIVDLMNHD
jgi:predicted PurR-regulated permease PerM